MKSPFLAHRRLAISFLVLGFGTVHAGSHDGAVLPASGTEPAAQLFVDAPLAAPLAKGTVVLPFHTAHMKIAPMYGESAQSVVPRVGHLHITVDRASWHWVHALDDVIVVQGLSQGLHHITVELAQANHHVVAAQEIAVMVP